MNRLFVSLAVLGVFGCASAPTSSFDIGPGPEREPSTPVAAPRSLGEPASSPAEFLPADDLIPIDPPAAGFEADFTALADETIQGAYPPPQGSYPPPQGAPPPPGYPPPQGAPPPQVVYVAPAPPPFRRSRFTLKGGWYSVDDSDHLDDGFIIEGTWANFFSPNFATELELGYLDVDGKKAGVKTDLWGIPFMFNARLSIPVKVLELYGGAGIGSIWYNIDNSPGGGADGWVAAADTFLGAAITLKNGLMVGIEGKYYFTESVHNLDGGFDSFAAMLTLGIAR